MDGRIRDLLQWGLPAPGGKGRPRGFAESFLATTLLADQRAVAAMLDRSLVPALSEKIVVGERMVGLHRLAGAAEHETL